MAYTSVYNAYLDMMDASYDEVVRTKSIGYINLSTMTMIATLDGKIDIALLNSNFKSPGYPVCTLIKSKDHHEYELTSRGKKKKSFYNQTTIKFTDCTTKSIKIFSNGRLQLTGITSITEAVSVSSIICGILNSIPRCTNSSIDVKDVAIAMINTNFSYNCGIDITMLQKLLEGKDKVYVSFNAERYPGLNIKHIHSDGSMTSVLFFGSGRVVITGGKQFDSITKSFKMITDIVYKNFDQLKTNVVQSEKVPKYVETSFRNGYNAKQLRCVGL